jgi:endonuclease/exonuclease/phosphatase family metal-dependent hydrolase
MSYCIRGWRKLVWLLVVAAAAGCAVSRDAKPAPRGPGDYQFCFWNVENLFDDKVDGSRRKADREFDEWFANKPEYLEKKLENLCKVLLDKDMNEGNGPDILAVAEVETYRAAEMLQEALNKRIADPAQHYTEMRWKDPSGGRSIACAVLTRLHVVKDKTRLLGEKKHERILEVHLEADGKELVVVASHWSSRVKDKEGRRRSNYADTIYGRYRAMYTTNPKVAFLVCGDFNTEPNDPGVTEHLHAIGDAQKVRAGGLEPLLYNLFAAFQEKGEGTHNYRGRWFVYDQIVVSPAMLGGGPGWTVDPASARIVRRLALKGRPDRFGGPSDRRPLASRGASDHFPVTVQLSVGK